LKLRKKKPPIGGFFIPLSPLYHRFDTNGLDVNASSAPQQNNLTETMRVLITAIWSNSANRAPRAPMPATTFNGVFDMSQQWSAICTLTPSPSKKMSIA
jgi:hypothetical protein